MENAVEALKTAAAVLIFVIALTVSFTMFSKAKQTADAVVTSSDKQEYLEAADLESVLYTSSSAITSGESTLTKDSEDSKATMTTAGDRIVSADDVISTIYRYNLEKYGVTLIKSNGTVLVRFDSNTESVVRQWNNIKNATNGGTAIEAYQKQIANNISVSRYNISPTIDLEKLYAIDVDGGATDDGGNKKIKCGAPWYGNETEIIKRINADINGGAYKLNGQTRKITETPAGKGINKILSDANKIIEVVNEIDNSTYLTDNGDTTSLLQQYELPTIEVVYIIY